MNLPRRLAAPLLGAALLVTGCSDPVLVEREWSDAGGGALHARVHTFAETDARRALEEIRGLFAAAEAKLLHPDGDSGLGALNRAAAEDYYPVEDQDLYRCLLLALDYAKVSEGAFDPTVGSLTALYERHGGTPPQGAIDALLPGVGWQNVAVASEKRAVRFRRDRMRLDLGGVARGFALDVAARAFARPGVLGGVVRTGGNLYAWGEAPGRKAWIVEVPDPREEGGQLLRLGLTNRGVAVSGHPALPAVAGGGAGRTILDPADGRPAASDLLAAVAIADSGADADALATALFVAGSMRGAEILQKMRRVEAVMVVRGDGGPPQVLASASLRGRLELSESLAAESGGEVRYLLPPESL
jgi:thiamine biosynthesis lipoprotein